MNKPSFTSTTYRPRALAQARTAALVNDYRNRLFLLYLGLLLTALEQAARAEASDARNALPDVKRRAGQPLRGRQAQRDDENVEHGATAPRGNRPTRSVGPQVTDPTFGVIRTVTRNSFDTLGNLTQVSAGRTDGGGLTPANDIATLLQLFAFDDFSRKIRETDVNGQYWRDRYAPQEIHLGDDDNGNLTQATEPKRNPGPQLHLAIAPSTNSNRFTMNIRPNATRTASGIKP